MTISNLSQNHSLFKNKYIFKTKIRLDDFSNYYFGKFHIHFNIANKQKNLFCLQFSMRYMSLLITNNILSIVFFFFILRENYWYGWLIFNTYIYSFINNNIYIYMYNGFIFYKMHNSAVRFIFMILLYLYIFFLIFILCCCCCCCW
jgi:hypothetical protein